MIFKDYKTLYIEKYKYQIPNRAERILKSTLKAIEYDLKHCHAVPIPPNISSEQRACLQQLSEDQRLIISPADKGDKIVVLNTSQYLDLAYSHLNDNSTYQLLQTDPTQEIARQYNDYLLRCKNEGVITYHQH